MKVRCVTINVKGLELGWFDGGSTALIQGVKQYDPDIVYLYLQETTVRQDSPIYNQARAIGAAWG